MVSGYLTSTKSPWVDGLSTDPRDRGFTICTGNIVFQRCECMVGKSTLCLVFDLVGSVNGTTSNRVARLHETENMCRVSTKG